LYMHDHTKPIGKATRVWLDKTGAKPLEIPSSTLNFVLLFVKKINL